MTLSSAARFLDRINQSARAAIARSAGVVSRDVSQLITISPLGEREPRVAQTREGQRERERERVPLRELITPIKAFNGNGEERTGGLIPAFGIRVNSRKETRARRLAFTDTSGRNYRLT